MARLLRVRLSESVCSTFHGFGGSDLKSWSRWLEKFQVTSLHGPIFHLGDQNDVYQAAWLLGTSTESVYPAVHLYYNCSHDFHEMTFAGPQIPRGRRRDFSTLPQAQNWLPGDRQHVYEFLERRAFWCRHWISVAVLYVYITIVATTTTT